MRGLFVCALLIASVQAAVRPTDLRATFQLVSGPRECAYSIRFASTRNVPTRETVEIDVENITFGTSRCRGDGYIIMAFQDGNSLSTSVRKGGRGGGGGGRPGGGSSRPSGGSSRPGGSSSRPSRPSGSSSRSPGRNGFSPSFGSVLRPSGTRISPPKGSRLKTGGINGRNWVGALWVASQWRGGKGRAWKKRRKSIGGDEDTDFERISDELDRSNIDHYFGYHAEPSLVELGIGQNFTKWGFQCGRYGAEFRTKFMAFKLDRQPSVGRLSPFSNGVTYLLTSGTTFDDELSPFQELPCVYYSTSDATSGGPVCLPADAPVRLPGGGTKRAEQLAVGDYVDVGGQGSPVFMFSHADGHRHAPFVRMVTQSGAALELTHGHYLYVNGVLAPAGAVRPGDILRRSDARIDPVIQVTTVMKRGLYNPQTTHGDIAVGEFVISTYTEFADPQTAHPLLAPLRALYRLFRWSHSVNGLPQTLKKIAFRIL